MRREWTYPEIKKLEEMAIDGYCAEEVSEELGRSRHSVQSKAYSLGLHMAYPCGDRNGTTEISDLYVAAIRTLKREGFTSRQISEIFSRSRRVSTNYVKKICYEKRRTKNDNH